MNLMKNEYQYNSNFRKYVDEYCDKNRCTVDEAFDNEAVKRMFWRYTESMTIELKTIQDVKDFVEISSKYHDSDIVAKQGRYIVDGKSILGIFSLNLLEPMVVIADSENDNLKISFYNTIEKWKVDNRD